MSAEPSSRLVRSLRWLFEGHRAPAYALALVVLYKLALIALLLVPASSSGFGQFAEEFKTWCFGYDPATGKLQVAYVVAMLTEPVILGGAVLLFWGRELLQVVRGRPRKLAPSALFAVATLLAGGAALGAMGGPAPTAELPFPAEALRTALPAPAFVLEDQEGRPVSPQALRGKVVVLTGVYASCGATCPMIMGQSKRVVEALSPEERADVVVIAVTLDPTRDDRERRAAMAKGQGVSAPTFRLVGGDPAEVERVLDDLAIARKRDPQTGVIDHVNLFAVLDRQGRLAYRFSLGERQEDWLGKALGLLVRERP
ncbi:MAG: SCO family protein [Polyangiaceae bacterium]|nr:SCO family protein [Polyangiaceae bacterium]